MAPKPNPRAVSDYVAALIQSSAQISMIINQMEQFARRTKAPRTRPPVAILSELVEGIVQDPALELDLSGLERSCELLVVVTDAIGQNLFFVDPDAFEDLDDELEEAA